MDNDEPLIDCNASKPSTPKGVPYFLHDYFGPGKHAKVISSRAKDLLADGNKYRKENGLTGNESLVTEVSDVDFPELLHPVDDLPPCTIITRIDETNDRLRVRGTTHDNGVVKTVSVNGKPARILNQVHGVADWSIDLPKSKSVTATATDATGRLFNIVEKGRRRTFRREGELARSICLDLGKQ